MEINADYVIRRTILFDNKCGFVLGENPRAPNPYVTWQFNEQDGHRDYFWGHYHNEPDMAERDLHNRAEDYQRRYHVQEVEQAPDRVCHPGAACRPCSWGGAPSSGQGPQGGQAADCPADENRPKTGRGAPEPDRPQEVRSPP